MPADFNLINEICTVDAEELEIKEQSYGDSWKQRGGVGAFMMLARKWDRIENQCRVHGYDVFVKAQHEAENGIKDGLLDDIRDLRRYLLLVEQHVLTQTDPKNVMVSINKKLSSLGEPEGGYVNQD